MCRVARRCQEAIIALQPNDNAVHVSSSLNNQGAYATMTGTFADNTRTSSKFAAEHKYIKPAANILFKSLWQPPAIFFFNFEHHGFFTLMGCNEAVFSRFGLLPIDVQRFVFNH